MRKRFSVGIAAVGIAFCLPPLVEIAAAPSQDKVAKVGVITIEPHPRTIIHELPGRLAPTRVADVRPRVSGILTERLFHQGSDVKAGDPLYQIDPRPFEIDVQASEAAVAKAEAILDLARQNEHRIATLSAQHISAKAEAEKATAAMREADADLAARKADLAGARLKLDYATIRAPISGRIGAAVLSEGALVVQNDTVNLATIQQLDPIYADFTQSIGELQKLRRSFERGDLERTAPDAARVRLILDDGSQYPLAGKLLFSEAKVDADTGQVTLRGEFPNPKRELLPGMYMRVQIEQGIDSDAIAIPQQAIQRDSGGGSKVFVVKNDGTAAIQPLRIGSMQGGEWLVLDGLKSGDRVIVDGFQKFVAGDHVDAQSFAPTREAEKTGDAATVVLR